MSWQAIAEKAARARGEAIIAKVRAAIDEHAPGVGVEIRGNELRARGRGLKSRWISEAGLRFARRIGR